MKRSRLNILTAALTIIGVADASPDLRTVVDAYQIGLEAPAPSHHLRRKLHDLGNKRYLSACIGRFPGYDLDLGAWVDPNGVVKILFDDNDHGGTAIKFEFDLRELEDHCKDCRIHIASGTTCEDANEVGRHYWNSTALNADPWTKVNGAHYSSNNNGKAIGGFDIDTGYGYDDLIDHAIVIYAQDGRQQIGCGVLEARDHHVYCAWYSDSYSSDSYSSDSHSDSDSDSHSHSDSDSDSDSHSNSHSDSDSESHTHSHSRTISSQSSSSEKSYDYVDGYYETFHSYSQKSPKSTKRSKGSKGSKGAKGGKGGKGSGGSGRSQSSSDDKVHTRVVNGAKNESRGKIENRAKKGSEGSFEKSDAKSAKLSKSTKATERARARRLLYARYDSNAGSLLTVI